MGWRELTVRWMEMDWIDGCSREEGEEEKREK
jgi:hypothetical protein